MKAAAQSSKHLAYVALGANLDDPAAQVHAAALALAKLPHSQLLRCSARYRTAPVGIADGDRQPEFINAVAALETTLTPQQLLAELQKLEQAFGRRRDFYQAPRTLDLDLLLFDEQSIASEQLCLPHPRMHLRAFVLAPLVEIAPHCRIPGRGSAAAWLPAVSMQAIQRLSG
jgi:2-amino-4-hydroxy-6-hydroxymethyldihydropteridine diphosphokinase